MDTYINLKGYGVPSAKRVTLTVDVALDLVPGPWHDPMDFVRWLLANSYVEAVHVPKN